MFLFNLFFRIISTIKSIGNCISKCVAVVEKTIGFTNAKYLGILKIGIKTGVGALYNKMLRNTYIEQ